MPAKTYKEVLDRYDRAKAFGEKRSLPEYAQHLNDIYQNNDFSAGLRDGPWTRFSTRVDQSLQGQGPYGNELTGLPAQLLGGVGGAVGSVFGQEEAGQRVGESLPRGLANMAPMFIPGVGELYGGSVAAGLTGALMGGHTYADTGNAKAATISGAAGAALPYVSEWTGGLGAQLAGGSRVAGETAAGPFNRVIGNEGNVSQVDFGRFLGSQAGQLGTNVASGVLQDHAQGGSRGVLDELQSPDLWMSQIPWTVYDSVKAYNAPRLTKESVAPMLRKAEPAVVPERQVADGSDEAKAQVSAFNDRMAEINNDPVSTPEMKAKAFQDLITSVQNPAQALELKKLQQTTSTPDNISIAGDKAEQQPNGNWKMTVLDSQNETNAANPAVEGLREHGTVWVNSKTPPTFDKTSGQWLWRGPKNEVDPRVTIGFQQGSELDNHLNPMLSPRPEGVVPTATAPHIPGVGGGELPNYESPALEGQPPDLSSAEATGMVEMGQTPQAVADRFARQKRAKQSLFLGEAVTKGKNAMLNMFQGKVLKDTEGNVRVLGGRDVPIGPMAEGEFVSRTALSPTLLPLMKSHYPEAFTADGKVDPTKLVKGLEERPLTEVMKAGEGTGVRLKNDVIHDLENWNYTINEDEREKGLRVIRGEGSREGKVVQEGTPEFEALPENIRALYNEYKNARSDSGLEYSSHYSISPNPRGGTEIAVVAKPGSENRLPNGDTEFTTLPADTHHGVPGLIGTATVEEKTLGELRATMGADNPKLTRFAGKPDGAVIGVQTEAQSDWEGEVRDRKENAELEKANSFVPNEYDAKTKELEHPLLPYWERLVADAVIQHGLERGWEGVVVTDAKTAAMTEGHDQNVRGYSDSKTYSTEQEARKAGEKWKETEVGPTHVTKTEPGFELKVTPVGDGYWKFRWENPTIEQFPGHAQHYGDPDFRIGPQQMPGSLQQEFAKATGEENTITKGGENVMAVGVHKGAQDALRQGLFGVYRGAQEMAHMDTRESAEAWRERQLDKANLVIREQPVKGSPSLTDSHPITGAVGPKVYATGNFYSFDKIRGGLEMDQNLATKEAVMRYDQAKQKEDAARKALEVVPTKAEEWAGLVPRESVKEVPGTTPEQSVESARLLTHTPALDSALQEQEIAKDEVEQVINPVQTEYKGKQVKSRGRSLVRIQADEGGRAGSRYYFKTESEAKEFLDNYKRKNPTDDNPWEVSTGQERGKGKYYLGVFAGKGQSVIADTSLDAPVGGGKGDLHQAIGEQTPQMQEEHTSSEAATEVHVRRPQVSAASLLANLDLASRSLPVFANHTGLDVDESRLVIQQAKTVLPKILDGSVAPNDLDGINALLVKSRIPGFTNIEEMQEAMRNARDGADAFEGKKHFTLDSVAPHDEALVAASGIRESLTKHLLWGADQLDKLPEFEQMGALVRDLTKALGPNLDTSVDVNLPGDLAHEPRRGWQYYTHEGVRPTINVADLPENASEVIPNFLKVAHEVAHFATRELAGREDNLAVNFKKTLEEVRQKLADSPVLPKSVRALVKRSAIEGHIDKFATGEWSATTLIHEWEKAVGRKNVEQYFPVIYGLSNRDELLSQVFGSPQMVDLATNTRMKKGVIGTALEHFTNAWNTLFGRKESDSALAQLLHSFDNYLVPTVYADGYNGRDLIRDHLISTYGVRDVALASRMKTAEALVNTGDLAHSIYGFQREENNGLLPVTAKTGEVNEDLNTALLSGATPDVHKATMRLLIDELPRAQELWHRMSQDVALTKQVHAEMLDGSVPGEVSKDAQQNLSAASQKVASMRRALDKQANALAIFQRVAQLNPEGREVQLASQLFANAKPGPPDTVPDARALRAEMGLSGEGDMTFWSRALALTSHVKEAYPALRPAIERTYKVARQINSVINGLNIAKFHTSDPLAAENGNIDEAQIKAWNRVRNNSTLMRAASDLMQWKNKQGKMDSALDMRDPEVREIFASKLGNPNDRRDVISVLDSVLQRFAAYGHEMLPTLVAMEDSTYTAQLIARRETGMLPDVARDLSEKLYNGLAKLVNPVQAQIGAQELGVLQQQMSPDTYIKALQHAQILSARSAKWLKTVQEKPGWSGEQRYDKHMLFMKDPQGKSVNYGNDSLDYLRNKAKELKAKGYTVTNLVEKGDRSNPSYGVDEAMLRDLSDRERVNRDAISDLLADMPEQRAAVLAQTNLVADVKASMQGDTPKPSLYRKFAEGRQEINMLDNNDEYYNRMGNYFKNRLTRANASLDSLHPDMQVNKAALDYLGTHVDSLLTPDNPVASAISKATYFWKLAFDFGNAMLESTQNLTTGMSTLIGETGSVGQAFDLWHKSVKEITQHFVTKKWANDDHTWLMAHAAETGMEGWANWEDAADPTTNSYYSSQMGSMVNPVGLVVNKAKDFTRLFTRYNSRIALLAGFDLARERGMSHEEAFDWAVNSIKAPGLFDIGKAQRPGFYGLIKSRSVAQMIGALQNYTLGWFGQMGLMWKRGFSGQPPVGLSDTQRLGAKKAFVYSLAAQAALAGALGLPGVGQGLALLNQATGLDLKGKMLANLNQLFGEDQESGGTLTGLAMHGVGAYGLPFDPSGRASISVPFLGVDSYKGFSVANLGGAATSTVGDFVEGLLGLANGDKTQADKLLPNVAKRPVQLWQGEGDIRDQRGTLIAQLSPAERFLMAAGLTPSRVQSARDTSEAVKKANLVAQRQKESQVDAWASLARQGKLEEVQLQLIQYLKEHPYESYKNLAASVSSRVEAQTVPYDWRRDVNPGADLSGLSSLNPSTEALRRQVRSGVSQSLGVLSRSNPRSDYVAQQMDWLMDSGLSKSEAAQQSGLGKQRVPQSYNVPGIGALQ